MNTRDLGLQNASMATAAIETRDDEVDPRVFSPAYPPPEEPTPQPFPEILNTEEDFEKLEKYNMQHKRRGVALIFNHEFFEEKNLKRREGAERDGLALMKTVEALGFEARYYKDLNVTSLKQILIKASKEDHSDCDCFLVAVMSHGEEGGILYAKDHPFKAESVWSPFTADLAGSLAGKPKIFLFQACRGRSVEESYLVTDSTDYPAKKVFSVPTNADFLMAYSTMEGYYSWRNPGEGSWFIQDFCVEVNKNARQKDFMTIMTFVLRRVAFSRCSNVPRMPGMHMKKQMPVITSTLTRLLYFDETSL